MEVFKKYSKYWFLAVLGALVFVVWYAVAWESREGVLVAFLDVGQGDAIFIQSPNGNQVLVDAGPGSKILEELSKVIPFYDRSLDLIIATHPDSDHIAGFLDILKTYRSDLAMEPGVDSESAFYREFERLLEKNNVKKILARRGMKVMLDDNVYLDILFPDRDVSRLDTNDASIVAKLVFGNTSFLLTGDSPQKIENYLVFLDGGPPAGGLKSDVLKAGHHGSRTSTGQNFLEAVKPTYVIVSAGKDNRYGHPHQEVLDILEKFQVKILRTGQEGTIKIKSNGRSLQI